MGAHADTLILQGVGEFVESQLGPIVPVDRAPGAGPAPRSTDPELDVRESVRVEQPPGTEPFLLRYRGPPGRTAVLDADPMVLPNAENAKIWRVPCERGSGHHAAFDPIFDLGVRTGDVERVLIVYLGGAVPVVVQKAVALAPNVSGSRPDTTHFARLRDGWRVAPQSLERETRTSAGSRPRVHTSVHVVGRNVVAVVIDSGAPSFPTVDVVCARDQARLTDAFREPHILAVHIVEDDVLLPRDVAGVGNGGREESHPAVRCTGVGVRGQVVLPPGEHEEELPPQCLQRRPAPGGDCLLE